MIYDNKRKKTPDSMIFLSLTMINEQTKLWSGENHEIPWGFPSPSLWSYPCPVILH